MNLKYLIATSAVAIAAATSVQAADVIRHTKPGVLAPVVAPVPSAFSFKGAYAGLQAGFSLNNFTRETPATDNKSNEVLDTKRKEMPAGIFVGYNIDMTKNVIVGLEADASYDYLLPIKSEKTHVSEDAKPTHQLSAAGRLRLGYQVGRVLPFVDAGVASTSFGREVNSATKYNHVLGLTAGAGLDIAATNHAVVRFEYRFSKFAKEHVTDSSGTEVASTNQPSRDAQEARVGVAYKF